MDMAVQLHVGNACTGSTPQGELLPNGAEDDRASLSDSNGGTSSASPDVPHSLARTPRSDVPSSALRTPRSLALSAVLIRFLKFCLVGGSGMVVDMGVLFLLADPRMLGMDITFSKICAAETALINNFVWNELWTFRASEDLESAIGNRKSKTVGVFRRLAFFNAICGIGIGMAVILLNLFHNCLGGNLYLSNFAAIIIVTFWNFGMNSKFNWAVRRA